MTHVRLTIHPDGGVARLRVHGTVLADPRLVDAGPFDLAALENGGLVTAVSNEFYGRPQQLIGRGLARSMGEGWETARRRDSGNDWVEVSLACEGVVALAELDTSWFLGNAPGQRVADRRRAGRRGALLPRTRLQPDTRHRFVLDAAPGVRRVRLDVFPDGGMARLRLWGRPTAAGRSTSAGAGSTRCPTSRRWRCSARSACRRRTPAGSSAPGPCRESCPGGRATRRRSARLTAREPVRRGGRRR